MISPGQSGAMSFHILDVATREVLQKVQVSSNARGFGLRNYWAGSVYSLTKRKLFGKLRAEKSMLSSAEAEENCTEVKLFRAQK